MFEGVGFGGPQVAQSGAKPLRKKQGHAIEKTQGEWFNFLNIFSSSFTCKQSEFNQAVNTSTSFH